MNLVVDIYIFIYIDLVVRLILIEVRSKKKNKDIALLSFYIKSIYAKSLSYTTTSPNN